MFFSTCFTWSFYLIYLLVMNSNNEYISFIEETFQPPNIIGCAKKLCIRLQNLRCTFLRLLQKWVQHTGDNYQLEYYTLFRKLACNENFQQLKSNQKMKVNIAFTVYTISVNLKDKSKEKQHQLCVYHFFFKSDKIVLYQVIRFDEVGDPVYFRILIVPTLRIFKLIVQIIS